MESSFELNFSGVKTPVLTSCCFVSANGSETKHSTQGKDFGWGKTTNAVVAMAMCAVAYKAWQVSGQPETTFQFVGHAGSAAHTLRGSLLKDHLPAWFRKVFGERKIGTRYRSYGSQVFQPVRPPKSPNWKKGKRLSAVTVDSENYPPANFRVLSNGKEVSSVPKLVKLAQKMEKQGGWKSSIVEPDLKVLRTRRQRLQGVHTIQLVASASSSKADAPLSQNPQALVLTTKKTTPQWADYRELSLGRKRLERLTCKIATMSDYFRFGFKFLNKDGRLFGDGSIQSQDANLVTHIGRNNWNRPNLGITARDIFFAWYLNGIPLEGDKRLFSAGRRLTAFVELKIDSRYVATFSINGVCCLNRVIPPGICRRVAVLAWGDREEYAVEVSDLLVTPASVS